MGIDEALKLLQRTVTYVPPGSQAQEVMSRYRFNRSAALFYLKPIEHGEDTICAWCNESPLTGKQQKYCGPDCLHSANFNFYPQRNDTKMWILIHRQQCACARCGESFEDEIIERAKSRYEHHLKQWERWKHLYPRKAKEPFEGISYWTLGYRTGHRFQVDHKEAIFRGGDGIGLDNIQILCVLCHKIKSSTERRVK